MHYRDYKALEYVIEKDLKVENRRSPLTFYRHEDHKARISHYCRAIVVFIQRRGLL